MGAAATTLPGTSIIPAGPMPKPSSHAAVCGFGRSAAFSQVKRLHTITAGNTSTELSDRLAASAVSVWRMGRVSLYRVENDDFRSRLFPQILHELADLVGNLLFRNVAFDLVAHLLERGHEFPAVALSAVNPLVTVGDFLRAHQHEGTEAKIEIALDRHSITENGVELLARQTHARHAFLQARA